MSDDTHQLLASQFGLEPLESKFLIALLNSPDLDVAEAGAACGLDRAGSKMMMRRPAVMRAFRAQVQDRNDRLRMVRDSIVAQLWSFTQYDIGDIYGPCQVIGKKGEVMEVMSTLPPNELPDQLRLAVIKVKPVLGGWEYALVDKSKIMLALLKHFGEQVKEDKSSGEAEIKRITAEYYDTVDPKMEALKNRSEDNDK